MKKDAVYYYDSIGMNRFMGFGQMLTLAFACYMKTRELGYTYTICEWHNKVAYLFDNHGVCKGIIKAPKNWKWDITFVDKGTHIKNIKSIDLSKPNSLFDGCSPIMNEKFIMIPLFEYLNKYHIDFNAYPIIDIGKNKRDKDYVLFHYRKSEQDRQLYRNTPDLQFGEMINKLKQKYGDSIEYKKFGEPSPFDGEFDEVIGYKSDNIVELFDLVNDCCMYVGSPTGTLTLAYMFGIPVILLLDNKTKSHYFGKDSNLKHGNTIYDWLNPQKMTYVHV